MAIKTYRSVDQYDGTIKYVCEHVYDAGQHLAQTGGTRPGTVSIFCEQCRERIDEGEHEHRCDYVEKLRTRQYKPPVVSAGWAAMIVTYRARHIANGHMKYACKHALKTAGYAAEAGPPAPDAPTFLCHGCRNDLDAGGREVRIHDEPPVVDHTVLPVSESLLSKDAMKK